MVGVTDLEAKFLFLTRVYGLPAPVREHRFHDTRRWRFDFAWEKQRVAVDVDGETAHRGWANMAADREKSNAAIDAGWKFYRFTGRMLRDCPNECMEQVKRALGEASDGS